MATVIVVVVVVVVVVVRLCAHIYIYIYMYVVASYTGPHGPLYWGSMGPPLIYEDGPLYWGHMGPMGPPLLYSQNHELTH